MTMQQELADFAGSIAIATTDPPDNYASWSSWTYETHMADLRELWSKIKPQVVKDTDKAEQIDKALARMFEAFDAGNGPVGRKEAMSIYNLGIESLR